VTPVSEAVRAARLGELAVLDETDWRLIELLRADGRMAFRDLAVALAITEAAVRARVRALESSGAMKVVAVADAAASGYELLLAVGVEVDGRPALEVAQALALLAEVFSVSVVIGTYDIELLLVARDHAHVAELVTDRLVRVPGVRRIHAGLAVEVLKNQPDWVPFDEQRAPLAADAAAPAESRSRPAGAMRLLDEIDRRILDKLAHDARTSNRRIADELGVTEGTVRTRIKRMQDEAQIRITALTNIRKLAHPALAFVWIEVDRSHQCREVARALAAIPSIGFVGLMVGRFDLLAITLVHAAEQLSEFLHTTVHRIPGVRHTECSLGARFVKHDYRISRIVPVIAGDQDA
jgi:Lrp/AsnC family transcriptional regulator for asnA, asnC and gidA